VYAIGRARGTGVLRPLAPEHPDDETFDGLLIARPEGRIFFANAQSVSDRINELIERHQPAVVALDMSRVPDIEYSALQMVIEADRRSAARGLELWLVELNPGVLQVVHRSGLAERLGPERLLPDARTAIERFERRQEA
jgi:anti-anti-sigma factor